MKVLREYVVNTNYKYPKAYQFSNYDEVFVHPKKPKPNPTFQKKECLNSIHCDVN